MENRLDIAKQTARVREAVKAAYLAYEAWSLVVHRVAVRAVDPKVKRLGENCWEIDGSVYEMGELAVLSYFVSRRQYIERRTKEYADRRRKRDRERRLRGF